MTDGSDCVIAGIDAHTDSHHVAVLDSQGRLLATSEFSATTSGYEALLDWVQTYGIIELVGVESTGAYAAGLTRALSGYGIPVVEVNQRHPHARQRRGKSDPIDAELAARAALSGQATATPKHSSGIVEAIRQLQITRESAVKARTAALNQLENLVVTAPEPIREQLRQRKTLQGKATVCLSFRPDLTRIHQPDQAAKLALRSLARRIATLDNEINDLESRLDQLVAAAAPATSSRFGVGTITTATLLVTAGQNIDRLKSEAAFARLCAAAPIPASSGRTTRHRLDRGGDRNANRALHMIAVSRLRYCPRTRAYADRRTSEGLNKKEIIRCLKRYIARELYHTLTTDLATIPTP